MEQSILKEFENKCTAENPPACEAACPFHLDVRSFATHLKNSEWQKARVILEKALPFAPLMSTLCDHPCEDVCLRKNLGQAVAIKELELACLEYSSPGITKKPLPDKGKKNSNSWLRTGWFGRGLGFTFERVQGALSLSWRTTWRLSAGEVSEKAFGPSVC